jgi:N6-L-threonylcarbamoyladenine synthase
VGGVGRYELLGETLDDAAGEAFDKTAQLLGLGYPGGPALARKAEGGDAKRYRLPRPMLKSEDLDFSFAGLKTAVLTLVRKEGIEAAQDIAAGFQAAAVDVLVGKSLAALERTGLERLVVAGGVGANRALRQRLDAEALHRGYQVFYPPLELCTDNGAMIAYAGALRLQAGMAVADGRFGVRPRWDLAELEAV